MNIYLYGPSGSGKSSTGAFLAHNLGMQWLDLDSEIERRIGFTVKQIFVEKGESGFRAIESATLHQIIAEKQNLVVSLGGGALLDPENRREVQQNGQVLCLAADMDTLLSRLQFDHNRRPLLEGNPRQQMQEMLACRQDHYDSFGIPLDTTGLTPEQTAVEAQIRLGVFRVSGMGQEYDICIQSGCLDRLGRTLLEHGIHSSTIVVSDENVAPLYLTRLIASLEDQGIQTHQTILPAGEQNKTIDTIIGLWQKFVQAKLERSSTIIALGGGVTGDLTGFAAATYLRGVAWVNVPTSLLAMVDSSLGGKTGADLPQGKNLIGAFHAPRFILSDPDVIHSLPPREFRNGMAETVKHGIIADPVLYQQCKTKWTQNSKIGQLISRSVSVKVSIIEADPYERGLRQALNFGHTVGHGVELASGYSLSHGESVAIGMVAETKLAEKVGIAPAGLALEIAGTLSIIGLPTEIPVNMDQQTVFNAMCLDKKRTDGSIHFALPEQIGKVRTGVVVEDWEHLLEF